MNVKQKEDEIDKKVNELLEKLTLEEKIELISGGTQWSTKPIPRLGIKPMFMTDGPHGIGPHSSGEKECTYFPVGICRASTWNENLMTEFGIALGEEVREIGYHVILGPGINIIRTPMCGRNFEYQTEDPFLNSRLVVPTVQGIQSRRISACVKHYICNNQEHWRLWVNAIVSDRALHEIYYPGFKAAVEEGDTWSIMGCYNRINGHFGCEHEKYLKEVLMNEWGFRGFVVSDWGALNYVESPGVCIRAGLSLEMPKANRYEKSWVKRELDSGVFTINDLDEIVRRLLRVMFFVGLFDDPSTLPEGSRNTREHQQVARKIAAEGIVLLKNEGDILPLDENSIKKISVIGPNADKKMGNGGGSSNVKPPHEITPLEGIKELLDGKATVVEELDAESDVTIVVVGLDHESGTDGEGGDKKSFSMAENHEKAIFDALEASKKVVIVLVNGSPLDMTPWIDKTPAVVEAWYAGMEGGRAIADVLFGRVNPSGKLPVTFPKRLEDSPAHASEETYPGIDDEDEGPFVKYEEGIYVGYRHFDAKNIEPLFPFGHGLSYTSFLYENIRVTPAKASLKLDEEIEVKVDITNVGQMAGAEVAQLYVEDVECPVDRPPRELKGFQKVFLQPGEKKEVKFTIKADYLKYYDESESKWTVEPGEFKFHVGSSSRDIRQVTSFYLEP
ncbi:MAG: glycoside hydrolase family 3 C-terminal domain-containing protein [Promethearchaeota archaeon]